MAIEKTVTFTSLQYVLSEATAFGGTFFTVITLIAGYWNRSLSSHDLITFAVFSYLIGVPFAISMRFFVVPIINRKIVKRGES